MAITLDGSTGVTAAEFDGALDASNLTGDIDASQLTGALPAIDGSALTGIDTAPPTAFDAVGTYAGLRSTGAGAVASAGDTFSGSALWTARIGSTITDSVTVSGTWRYMQYTNADSNGGLYVRIA